MSLLSVEGDAENLDKALMVCCESRSFQINDVMERSEHKVRGGMDETNPYLPVYSKIYDLAVSLKITPGIHNWDDVQLESAEDFEEWYGNTGGEYTKLKEEYDRILSEVRELNETDSYVKHLLGMNVSFEDLFAMKYITLRIGRLPADNLAKLEYYADRSLCFIPFEQTPEYVWGIYLAPRDRAEFADMIMSSLYFERTRLPEYLDGSPEEADKELQQEISEKNAMIEKLEREQAYFIKERTDELLAVMSKLKYKCDCFDLRKKALVSGGRFSFSGYCPTDSVAELSHKLENAASSGTVEIPIEEGSSFGEVPTKLKNNVFFRPFEMFVKMYGLPKYGGFDPTPYVAVTYMLLFGIMFGDVGQGLVVSVLGLVLTKFTKNGLAPIMTRIGLCSAAFGVLYGSVFGIETIIPPFFHREVIWRALGYAEQPENIFQAATTLLIAALGIGIVLLLISMIFNTVLSFKNKNTGEALFGVNGLSGIVFYVSTVAALAAQFMFGFNLFSVPYVLLLIVTPLILIFFKKPLSNRIAGIKNAEKVSAGNFIIENFIELFETALSFLSNTMSFLRVGGFILSHAGMMLVVGQLSGANVEGAAITVPMVIIYVVGNLIVMAVEGLLVGIQVLRLEFYEIFNRFYDGSGYGFSPIEIQFETEN